MSTASSGDLAAVDGSGFGKQERARRMARRMAAFGLQPCQPQGNRDADRRMADHLVGVCIIGQVGMRAAGRDVWKHQEAHLVAAMTGHDDVLRQRCQRSDPGDAQRADADPGAGIELEILRDAAVEEQA